MLILHHYFSEIRTHNKHARAYSIYGIREPDEQNHSSTCSKSIAHNIPVQIVWKPHMYAQLMSRTPA